MLEKLVLASANPGKVAEMRQLLAGMYIVEPRPDGLAETVEDGVTLEANAVKKAQEVVVAVGQAAMSDDTGLFVAALDGRPGVRTARFAGPGSSDEANVAKLLAELSDVEDRSAYFCTVVALVRPDGSITSAQGEVHGVITTERRGAQGFGYDCVFQPNEGSGETFAEMESDEKNAISHRGRALKALAETMKQT